MCLVEVEKTPKLQVGCTLPVAEGMVVHTDTAHGHARRARCTLEFLLTNHPLDCPVCDKGGECELQDMVFRYGAGESRFTETKVHVDEKQWSPVVFLRCARAAFSATAACASAMKAWASARWASSIAASFPRSCPIDGDHLECDECGMCIDICPVGALTSGTYRYKTRPWEMEHVGHHLHALLERLQDHARRAQRSDHARQQSRPLRHQRRVPLHQGPLRVRFHDHPERLQSPMMRNERQAGAGLLVEGAANGREEVHGDQGARRQVRRDRIEPHHQRRELSICRSLRAKGWARRISIITARAMW